MRKKASDMALQEAEQRPHDSNYVLSALESGLFFGIYPALQGRGREVMYTKGEQKKSQRAIVTYCQLRKGYLTVK